MSDNVKVSAEYPVGVYPVECALTGGTSGPVVWFHMKVRNQVAAVVLNRNGFWELVRDGSTILSDAQKLELVGLLGGYTQADLDAVTERAETAEREATEAHADLSVIADRIAEKVLDNVIDLEAERAKRRPAEVVA